MKKVTTIALMLALAAALLTACRSPMSDETPNESTRPSTAPTTTAPTTAPTTTAPTTTAPTTTTPSTTSPTEGTTDNTTQSREPRMPGM